jgi:hypothetical protein
MGLRKIYHALHRDIGYLCVGLTLVYALSGIAVNHLHHWNPNYKIESSKTQIEPSNYRGVVSGEMILELLRRINEPPVYENFFQPNPETLMVFVDGRVIQFHLPTGVVDYERAAPRAFWHNINFLHLNHPKKAWTWIADLYAVGLIFLALTGLLLLPRGRMRPRCIFLTVAGFIIPLLTLIRYY